jgi:hypothetical protein
VRQEGGGAGCSTDADSSKGPDVVATIDVHPSGAGPRQAAPTVTDQKAV